MDPDLTPFEARGMPEQVERFAFMFRVAFWTYGLIGTFGLILACAGLAGVTAFCVAQRGREIGIRVALGARKADVLGLVMKEGAALVAIGSALGLAGAWAGTRGLSASQPALAKSVLASTSDPLVLVGVPLLLAGLTLIACYAPARRSTRIDPVVALRQE
jgi:ABC-type antimicrobial peptide transport system permease subunit